MTQTHSENETISIELEKKFMKLTASDPDIETVVNRILSGDLNLQPDFQRGEVWGEAKKKRLIDSILRNWHIPPIHTVVVEETNQQVVLDGQQRLAAIRDFFTGELKVDGMIEPFDEEIRSLDGLTYDELPEKWRRHFNQFSLSVFKITDYRPEEPGELFYRLNQPVYLTVAEQRNAFFGPARQQVKELVELFEFYGLDDRVLGFSNSRMAYDDVVAKICYTVDLGTLQAKVTAENVTEKYRSNDHFSPRTIDRVADAIRAFAEATKWTEGFGHRIKFNKTTLYSWLCLILGANTYQARHMYPELLGEYILRFEGTRISMKKHNGITLFADEPFFDRDVDKVLFGVYNDRASSRVADVTSILTRDLILWMCFFRVLQQVRVPINPEDPRYRITREYSDLGRRTYDVAGLLEHIIDYYRWGTEL